MKGGSLGSIDEDLCGAAQSPVMCLLFFRRALKLGQGPRSVAYVASPKTRRQQRDRVGMVGVWPAFKRVGPTAYWRIFEGSAKSAFNRPKGRSLCARTGATNSSSALPGRHAGY